MGNMERIGEAYIGNNASHRLFVQKIVMIKMFVYIFIRGGDDAYKKLKVLFENSEKQMGDKFAYAIVTKGISNTQAKTINIRNNEIKGSSITDYYKLVYGTMYTDVHRIFNDYLVDIYEEIVYKNPQINRVDNLNYKEQRVKAFANIHLSITPNRKMENLTPFDNKIRLNELEQIRHIIEHNNSTVNQRFKDKCQSKNYNIGPLGINIKASAK